MLDLKGKCKKNFKLLENRPLSFSRQCCMAAMKPKVEFFSSMEGSKLQTFSACLTHQPP